MKKTLKKILNKFRLNNLLNATFYSKEHLKALEREEDDLCDDYFRAEWEEECLFELSDMPESEYSKERIIAKRNEYIGRCIDEGIECHEDTMEHFKFLEGQREYLLEQTQDIPGKSISDKIKHVEWKKQLNQILLQKLNENRRGRL